MNATTKLAAHLGRDLRGTALAAARTALGPDPVHEEPAVVTEADVSGLPEPAQRYLRYMGVTGRPRVRSFCVRFSGRFRRGPHDRWMACEAWQVNVAHPVTRVFHMRLEMLRIIPMVGHDTYVEGRGAMHGKVLGLVPVADGEGEPFDVGELTTFVDDALLLAPSMLIGPQTRWTSDNGHSFEISFSDAGHTVSGRVEVDELGALREFSTEDRYMDRRGGPVRTRWSTPVTRWVTTDEGRFPADGRAVWHEGPEPFTYMDGQFDIDSLEYDPI